ncbi:MAG: hypothetical protein HC805_06845 [Alkalinema sp. RL_2_19]|nr:hypothetical protein [Alkalinema sp. RL_2_19]
MNERSRLQTDLRTIAQKMQAELCQIPDPQTPVEALVPTMEGLSLPEMLALPGHESDLDDETEASDIEEILILDDDDELSDSHDRGISERLRDELSNALSREFGGQSPSSRNDSEQSSQAASQSSGQSIAAELKALFSLESLLGNRQPQLPDNPVDRISFWHDRVESQAHQCLRQTSSEVNRLMQNRKILPGQIPAPILEAAALAEGGEGFGKPPTSCAWCSKPAKSPPATQNKTK